MARLVFDIETSALPREQFDAVQQEYLFREAERMPEGGPREAREAELVQQMNLWPLTAQVVCIAMLNADTGRGQVLFHMRDAELVSQLIEGNFPDYKVIIPRTFKTRTIISTPLLHELFVRNFQMRSEQEPQNVRVFAS